MDDRVRGVVNVSIQGTTFDGALEKLLLPLGFAVGRCGKQCVIGTPDPSSPLFPCVSPQMESRPKHAEVEITPLTLS